MKEVRQRFGQIAADSQVYAAERLLLSDLVACPSPAPLILRYRIDYRAAAHDRKGLPKWMGVSHSFDSPLWWSQIDSSMDGSEEKSRIEAWVEPFLRFVAGPAGTSDRERDNYENH